MFALLSSVLTHVRLCPSSCQGIMQHELQLSRHTAALTPALTPADCLQAVAAAAAGAATRGSRAEAGGAADRPCHRPPLFRASSQPCRRACGRQAPGPVCGRLPLLRQVAACCYCCSCCCTAVHCDALLVEEIAFRRVDGNGLGGESGVFWRARS